MTQWEKLVKSQSWWAHFQLVVDATSVLLSPLPSAALSEGYGFRCGQSRFQSLHLLLNFHGGALFAQGLVEPWSNSPPPCGGALPADCRSVSRSAVAVLAVFLSLGWQFKARLTFDRAGSPSRSISHVHLFLPDHRVLLITYYMILIRSGCFVIALSLRRGEFEIRHNSKHNSKTW